MLWKVNPRFGQTPELSDVLNPFAIAQNATSQLIALPNSVVSSLEAIDPLATLNSAETGTENLAYNAVSGNLTQDQINAIKAQTNASIVQASGGNTELAASEQDQAASDIQSVVQSGLYTGPGNLLSDASTVGTAVTAGTTGILAWIEANTVLLLAAAAAFVIFRPDKAFSRR